MQANIQRMTYPRTLPVARVRLSPEAPARNDPLGRTHTGFRPGMTDAALWNRARGLWKASADRLLNAGLLLVTHDRTVQLVVDIRGVMKYGDALEIVGTPLADHPLTGQVDPLDNNSHNPVAYGEIAMAAKELG